MSRAKLLCVLALAAAAASAASVHDAGAEAEAEMEALETVIMNIGAGERVKRSDRGVTGVQ